MVHYLFFFGGEFQYKVEKERGRRGKGVCCCAAEGEQKENHLHVSVPLSCFCLFSKHQVVKIFASADLVPDCSACHRCTCAVGTQSAVPWVSAVLFFTVLTSISSNPADLYVMPPGPSLVRRAESCSTQLRCSNNHRASVSLRGLRLWRDAEKLNVTLLNENDPAQEGIKGPVNSTACLASAFVNGSMAANLFCDRPFKDRTIHQNLNGALFECWGTDQSNPSCLFLPNLLHQWGVEHKVVWVELFYQQILSLNAGKKR